MGTRVTVDGNEAAAHVAFHANEVIAIYPITPASPMGELADQKAATDTRNVWGTVPRVVELQSEGGAAGAVHGALQVGALTTTFTASQGLLLMLPNMYKIAGELTPTVFHIACRSLATHALSIFGDHSDVMAVRQAGWGMLFANSVQEVGDFAMISQMASLSSRVPFLHCFDGFRTSHEIGTMDRLELADIGALIDMDLVRAHRRRGMSPDAPVLRGTAQNPDVFFQAREAINPYYRACPTLVKQAMARFAERTGRVYRLFDYVGAPDATRVVVLMGSGVGAAEQAVNRLVAEGEKVGVLKVRLYRPWSAEDFLAALPATAESIAVLDRTKEPGGAGEPLYLDVVTCLAEALGAGNAPLSRMPKVIGGRYGLSGKEFTPAMVKAILDELTRDAPKNHFTVGIQDDVTHTSLDVDASWSTEDDDTVRAVFFGLGSDGTVGANKMAIKIIGQHTDNYAQAYFVYDSKKSGSVTTSHLRFGPRPIDSSYLIGEANFVACHQSFFLDQVDVLEHAAPGATVLLNYPYAPEDAWQHLPRRVQEQIVTKGLKLFTIPAIRLAQQAGMGHRINTIMQPCFFKLSGVMPQDEALPAIEAAIRKQYAKHGERVVEKNLEAVALALDNLHEVRVPTEVSSDRAMRQPVASTAPPFVRDVIGEIIARRGDQLPVSAMPVDGTFPTATSQWEKRNVGLMIPVWDEDICIQCGKCVMVCPHSVIRAKVADSAALDGAPETLKSAKARWKGMDDKRYVLQVAPEDCTSCTLCVKVCPVKNKSQVRLKALNMAPQEPLRDAEAANWAFFEGLNAAHKETLNAGKVKDVQLLDPYFEFPGACMGCGETPYLRLMTQLFGDRAVVANATGCSSIYGANLPATPWSQDKEGRGPAWNNSLFEDNAEFGLGMRLALDKQREYAQELVEHLSDDIGAELVAGLLAPCEGDEGIATQRGRILRLRERLSAVDRREARDLEALADNLVPRSMWIIGGDGWAYDIGYGGLDHVLASGENVNILVLDTEVYSNTGGQASKATPRAAVAKFAHGGKPTAKKDLALMAMSYGNVYVARVALGANDSHTLKALREAESYDGPSLVLAYSACIAHGYDLAYSLKQQQAAVSTGYWPLLRFDPRRADRGDRPLQLDSKPPKKRLQDYIYNETRYTVLAHSQPEAAKELLKQAQEDVNAQWRFYQHLAGFGADHSERTGEEK